MRAFDGILARVFLSNGICDQALQSLGIGIAGLLDRCKGRTQDRDGETVVTIWNTLSVVCGTAAIAPRCKRQFARRRGIMNLLLRIATRGGHTLLLLLFAAGGTILLVRFAPGFFSDDREMDAKYAQAAQSEITAYADQQRSVRQIAIREIKSWLHGDFGESRQYHTPVADLVSCGLRAYPQKSEGGLRAGRSSPLCSSESTDPRQPSQIGG